MMYEWGSVEWWKVNGRFGNEFDKVSLRQMSLWFYNLGSSLG